MPDLGWIVLAVIVLAVAFVAYVKISESYRRRTGKGEWAEYGPNPSEERIRDVNRPPQYYFQGVSFALSNDTSMARFAWEKADELGEPRALTGLGILAWREGRKDEAKEYWATASTKDQLPAKILLRLTKKSGAPLTRDKFIESFLRVEIQPAVGGGDPQPLLDVARTAAFFGYDEYASKINGHARRLMAPRTIY